MNFTGFVACLLVAWQAAQYSQTDTLIFSASSRWIWWIIATAWAWSGVMFFVRWINDFD